MHARTSIRDALAAALISKLGLEMVHVEQRHRLEPGMLPAVILSLGDATTQAGERVMGGPFVVETDQTVTVELHATAATGEEVANALDALDLDVEEAFGGPAVLSGIAEIIVPGDSALEMNVEQDRVLGVRSVEYIVSWRHAFGAPDQPEG